MEESTAMTIEFLRARLLAERSVSKSARQRADDLAKRVMELEQQLKIISLQKMKAEKATANVLEILESNGISDVSDDLELRSAEDVVQCEPEMSDLCKKEEESSAYSEVERNATEECPGSELGSSSLSGRGLTWKSNQNSSQSHGKKNLNSPMRRCCVFASSDSSINQRAGRSCRQIRYRELRSAVEEPKAKYDGGASHRSESLHDCSDMSHETLDEASRNHGSEFLLEGLVSGSSEEGRKQLSEDGCGGEKDMERALRHQAQLIGQFEAEEKAQREWEEKFRENNSSSTPDSCEPGNYSDVTEERDEYKATRELKLKGKCADFTPDIHSPAPESASPINRSSRSPTSQEAELSGSKGELLLSLVPNEKPNSIVGVLEALRRAKQSLDQKLSRPSGSASMKVPEKAGVPFRCAQLLRVPNDFQFETGAKEKWAGFNSQDAWSGFSDPKPSPDPYFYRAGDRFVPSSCVGSSNGQLATSPFEERRDEPFGVYYPGQPFMSGEGSSQIGSGQANEQPPSDGFSFYDHPVRRSLYR